MEQRIVIATVIATGLTILGWLGYRAIFIDSTGASDAPSVVVETASTTDAGGVSTDAKTPPDARQTTPTASAVSIVGTVQRKTADGWVALTEGESLAADDIVRTGSDGKLTIAVGDATVDMDFDTQLAVATINAAVGRVRLGRGRVEATVPDDSDVAIGVDVAGSDISADTRQGRFAVLSPGKGRATVAAFAGEVEVSAKGKNVTLQSGQQTDIQPGSAPGPARRIPTSLFLKVQQNKRQLARKYYKVRGKTTPGSVITINGISVMVEADGSFVEAIALREGRNRVTIDSRDVSGRRQQSIVHVVSDTRGPAVDGNVHWGEPGS